MGISSFPATKIGFEPNKYINKYAIHSTPTLSAGVWSDVVNITDKKGRLNHFIVRCDLLTGEKFEIRVTADGNVVYHWAITAIATSTTNWVGVARRDSLDKSTNEIYYLTTSNENIAMTSTTALYLRTEDDGSNRSSADAELDLSIMDDGVIFANSLQVEIKTASTNDPLDVGIEYETN